MTNGQLAHWVRMTEGLSFAALAELVISVACLGNSIEETVNVLRMLDDQHPDSKEFDRPGAWASGRRGRTSRGCARMTFRFSVVSDASPMRR